MKDRSEEEKDEFDALMSAIGSMEISWMPEHNAEVRERRKMVVQTSESAKLRNELHEITKRLQEQSQEAKKESKRSTVVSWISIAIAAASLLVAFVALFK